MESGITLSSPCPFLLPLSKATGAQLSSPQTPNTFSLFSFSTDNLSNFTERIVLHQHFTSFPFDRHFSVGLPDNFMLLETLSSLDFQESTPVFLWVLMTSSLQLPTKGGYPPPSPLTLGYLGLIPWTSFLFFFHSFLC